MLLSLVIGLALASWAFYLVARAVNMPRMRTVENIAKIDSYGYSRSADSAQAAEDSSPMRGALDDIAGAVGSVVAGRFAGNREQEVRNHLMAAGLYGMTPRRFIGYQTLAAITFPAAWIWFSGTMGFSKISSSLASSSRSTSAGERRSSSSTVEVDIGSRRSTTSSRSSSTFSSSR